MAVAGSSLGGRKPLAGLWKRLPRFLRLGGWKCHPSPQRSTACYQPRVGSLVLVMYWGAKGWLNFTSHFLVRSYSAATVVGLWGQRWLGDTSLAAPVPEQPCTGDTLSTWDGFCSLPWLFGDIDSIRVAASARSSQVNGGFLRALPAVSLALSLPDSVIKRQKSP